MANYVPSLRLQTTDIFEDVADMMRSDTCGLLPCVIDDAFPLQTSMCVAL